MKFNVITNFMAMVEEKYDTEGKVAIKSHLT